MASIESRIWDYFENKPWHLNVIACLVMGAAIIFDIYVQKYWALIPHGIVFALNAYLIPWSYKKYWARKRAQILEAL